MCRSIDFTLQDLFSTLYSKGSDLVAQCFTRLGDLLISVSLGGSDDACSFFSSRFLGFLDDALAAFFGIADTLLTSFLCSSQFSLGTLLGSSQIRLAAFGSSQTVRDLLGALIERIHQRRPHEFHREAGEDEEDHELSNQGCIQVHGCFLLKLTCLPKRMFWHKNR